MHKEKWPGHVWLFLLLSVLSPTGLVQCYFGYEQWRQSQQQTAQNPQGVPGKAEIPAPKGGGPPVSIFIWGFLSSAVSIASLIMVWRYAFVLRDRQEVGITIESAKWGPHEQETANVKKQVKPRIAPDGSIDMEVSIDTLGDPFIGRKKYLWVTYSETKRLKIPEETSPHHLRLPEETEARLRKTLNDVMSERDAKQATINDLIGSLRGCQQELGSAKDIEAGLRSEIEKLSENRIVAKQSDLPQLLIQYGEKEGRGEIFTFINEGPIAIQRISLQVFEMKKRNLQHSGIQQTTHVDITLFGSIGYIVPKGKEESVFGARLGSNGKSLVSFMREFLAVDWECNYTLAVDFEDLVGNKFTRLFTFDIDLYDHVAIEAGPVLRVSTEAASEI